MPQPSPSSTTRLTRGVATALVLLVLVGGSGPRAQDDLTAEVSRLIELLELDAEAAVADVGAGSGDVSVEIARQLGNGSRVYSTDLDEDRLREIREAAADADLTHIIVLEGDANQTNLPDNCCDALFVRNVYHHFGDPPSMNASIRASLKPGGRFAVLDFPPKTSVSGTIPPPDRASGEMHGVTRETVVDELEEAGFEILQVIPEWPGDRFLVLARNPSED